MDCLIPIARWKGYGGDSNPNGSSFESLAWASGMLAATQRLSVFCTMHVPLHHPLVAAKQMATADHIGAGRLGINIVCGWNEDEFRMFGMSAREHDARYAQGEEWWDIVQRLWSGAEPFDYEGTYYQLRGVEGAPRPYGDLLPLMMNAGSSPAGRQFAIRHSDMHFDSVQTPEASRERIAETKRLVQRCGRDIQVWTPVGVVCRPSQTEAEEYVPMSSSMPTGARSAIWPSPMPGTPARGPIPRAYSDAPEPAPLNGACWRVAPIAPLAIRTSWRRSSPGYTPSASMAWPSTSSTTSTSCRISPKKSSLGSNG
jgi:alkanesulfonate monooxygenase SsuD/methylene tetrahydromethanopterin reductase-like flavin-dependent oxidoreductase (luciferase family)